MGGGRGENKIKTLEDAGVKDFDGLDKLIRKKTKDMRKLAAELEFEQAAALRDEIAELKDFFLNYAGQEQ